MVGERIAGRYELKELCGTGGMSSVYRARDTVLDRDVAIKILHEGYAGDEDYVERFRREARAAAQLSHPNIVTVIDRGQDDGHQYIVFEYIEGETLKDLVEREGPLAVRRALELTTEIARALGFAHEHGLVHRDVKPQNVLLNGDGKAKVTDFGIARSINVEHGMTQTGTVLGTSNYIAPEQASGQKVDAKTDVYALGVVLYELLTGGVPFPGENFVVVAMRHVHEPAPDVLERRPDSPLRVAAAVGRALEKDPARRFPSMDAFRAELEACLAELGDADGDPTLIRFSPVLRQGPRRRMRPRRPRAGLLLVVLGCALLAATAIGIAVALTHHAPPLGHSAAAAKPPAVHLRAAASFDPSGTGGEHDRDVPKATDGDAGSFWTTEHYNSFDKPGVGIVFDAGRPVPLRRLTVTTDTPGYTAVIKAGARTAGPFAPVSPSRTVGGSTTFALHGPARRYYLVWITKLAGSDAHVNEVRAQ